MTAKTPSATLTRLACTPRQACTLGDRTTDAPDSSIVPEPLCEGVDLQAGACISDAGTADGHAAPAGARSDCVVSCIDDALASLKQARERAAARLGGAAHRTVRVLVFGPHDIRREGLVRLLGDTDGIEIIGVAGTEDEAIVLVTSARPDVVLLDLARPEIDGPEVVRRLLVARDELRIVMLTNTADEGRVRAAIEAGVIGYL